MPLPIKLFDKWPNKLIYEVYEDPLTLKREGVFVIPRDNSRSFTFATMELLQTLVEFGHKVVVRVSDITDVSLEQFEKHGAWGIQPSRTAASLQGFYNLKSELKRLVQLRDSLPLDDPQREAFGRRVTILQQQLLSSSGVSESELLKSDKQLTNLADLLKSAEQGDNTNAERKSNVAGEVYANKGTDSEVTRAVDVSAKRESD